eukprot:scaffold289227_cov19-Prasinocladus_malaysianus.AAC.1
MTDAHLATEAKAESNIDKCKKLIAYYTHDSPFKTAFLCVRRSCCGYNPIGHTEKGAFHDTPVIVELLFICSRTQHQHRWLIQQQLVNIAMLIHSAAVVGARRPRG